MLSRATNANHSPNHSRSRRAFLAAAPAPVPDSGSDVVLGQCEAGGDHVAQVYFGMED